MRRFNLLCISLRRKPEAYIGSMLQSLPPWIFSSSDMARWECTGCEEGFLRPDWSASPKDNQTPRAYISPSLQMTTRPQGHTYFVSVSFAFLLPGTMVLGCHKLDGWDHSTTVYLSHQQVVFTVPSWNLRSGLPSGDRQRPAPRRPHGIARVLAISRKYCQIRGSRRAGALQPGQHLLLEPRQFVNSANFNPTNHLTHRGLTDTGSQFRGDPSLLGKTSSIHPAG